jgi:hypothetical protein
MFGSGLLYFMKDTIYVKDYYYHFFDKIDDEIDDKKEEQKNEQKEDKKEVKVIKYEDKYWDKYERMLNKEIKEKKDKEKEEKKELEGEEKNEKKEDKTEEIEISKNNILFETTPTGNVLMYYDSKRTSFIYYADTAIPYRYLESVARKYVTTYHCLHLYIDMKKEIAGAEKKINDKKLEEKQRLEKKLKGEEEKIRLDDEGEEKNKLDKDNKDNKDNKDRDKETKEVPRNVFAKLKNYNAGSNTVIKGNKVAETNPNRSSSAAIISSKKEYILKENANRFSYEGKMVNYKLLKKPERKVVDKNYGFSFADFKKMQESKEK